MEVPLIAIPLDSPVLDDVYSDFDDDESMICPSASSSLPNREKTGTCSKQFAKQILIQIDSDGEKSLPEIETIVDSTQLASEKGRSDHMSDITSFHLATMFKTSNFDPQNSFLKNADKLVAYISNRETRISKYANLSQLQLSATKFISRDLRSSQNQLPEFVPFVNGEYLCYFFQRDQPGNILCKYKTKSSGSFKDHERTHTGEKPFACRICDYVARTQVTLNRHNRIHTGEKPYSCDLCPFKARHAQSMVVHKRMHTGVKEFKCNFDGCSYASYYNRNLQDHLNVHSGNKPFHCKKYGCTYSATSSRTLCAHKCKNNFITPEASGAKEPFIENQIAENQKVVNLGDKLVAHVSGTTVKIARYSSMGREELSETKSVKRRSHSICDLPDFVPFIEGEYRCFYENFRVPGKPLCEFKTKSFSKFEEHERVHTGSKPHTCDICEYSSATKSALRRHQAKHTGERKYVCDLCTYAARHAHSLDRHKRKHLRDRIHSISRPKLDTSTSILFQKLSKLDEKRAENFQGYGSISDFSQENFMKLLGLQKATLW